MAKTQLVIILDKSGSMHGLEEDVIGGYNTLIEQQKKKSGRTKVTTILFDTTYNVVHDYKSIKTIPQMERKDYRPSGCTALLDTIGYAINNVKKQHAKMDKVPEHVIFSIMTDGLENSSRKYTYPLIKEMIEEQKKLGWDFIFQAANIDTYEEARKLGINRDDAVSFKASKDGVRLCFCCIDNKIAEKMNKKRS